MMFLSTWAPQPLLLSVGPIHVYWYGVMLALGAIGGYLTILWLGRRAGIDGTFLTDLFVLLVIGGFIGARLYHVTNEWSYYTHHPGEILQVWNGGLAIHGAMLVGILILIVMAHRKHLSAWKIADLLVIGLAIGQAIGRWGNYFNQELFGRTTNLPWKILIDEAHRPPATIGQAFYHPAFLYESIGSFLLFGLLLWIFRSTHRPEVSNVFRWWQTPGMLTLTYFVLYSLIRIGVESVRIDRVPVIAGFRLPMLTSILIILFSCAIALIRLIAVRTHERSH